MMNKKTGHFIGVYLVHVVYGDQGDDVRAEQS